MGLKERRKRERAERKNLILDAARDLLLEKGLAATSMNQIARRAELGIGTIYSYYASKEALFAELQEEGLDLLYRKMKDVSEKTSDPGKKLENMAWAYLVFSREEKDYFDIINYFLSSPEERFSPPLKSQVDQRGKKNLDIVTRVVREGIQAGAFRITDARRWALVLWATIHGLVQFRKFRNTILNGEDYEAIYRHAVRKLVSELSTRA
jgi:AcrR family transcriptional regulator